MEKLSKTFFISVVYSCGSEQNSNCTEAPDKCIIRRSNFQLFTINRCIDYRKLLISQFEGICFWSIHFAYNYILPILHIHHNVLVYVKGS